MTTPFHSTQALVLDAKRFQRQLQFLSRFCPGSHAVTVSRGGSRCCLSFPKLNWAVALVKSKHQDKHKNKHAYFSVLKEDEKMTAMGLSCSSRVWGAPGLSDMHHLFSMGNYSKCNKEIFC